MLVASKLALRYGSIDILIEWSVIMITKNSGAIKKKRVIKVVTYARAPVVLSRFEKLLILKAREHF